MKQVQLRTWWTILATPFPVTNSGRPNKNTVHTGLASTYNNQGFTWLSRTCRLLQIVRTSFWLHSKSSHQPIKARQFRLEPTSRHHFPTTQKFLCSHSRTPLPDFIKQFVIEADASHGGIGAVLTQDNHLIAYLSKQLSRKNLSLSIYDKEMIAIVFAVQHW